MFRSRVDATAPTSRHLRPSALLCLESRPGPAFNKLINTASLTARNAYGWGPEFGFRWRNFLVRGEYIQIGVNRSVTNRVEDPHLFFTGGYVEAAWTLTGEPRLYNPFITAFDRPIPAHPLSPSAATEARSSSPPATAWRLSTPAPHLGYRKS